MKTRLLACLFLPVAVYGRVGSPCRDSIPPQKVPQPHKIHHKNTRDSVQYGVASFYSDKFEGRKTYTDEIFTQDSLTGASNTLPMHIWVRVTNLRNNKSCIVRINDKMHPRNKRLIDLSLAAATRLGYQGRGLTRVRIDVLGKKRPPDAEDEMAVRQPGQD